MPSRLDIAAEERYLFLVKYLACTSISVKQLQYAHVANETVPGVVNTWLTFMLPLALVLLIGAARRNLKEVHHGALAIWSGYQLVNVATGETPRSSRQLYVPDSRVMVCIHLLHIFVDFVKLRVGRFRPDFFARCQYDSVLDACTGIPSVVSEGRKSFPSGHSSSAWFGCVFLMLFLAGKNRCFAFDATFQHSGILWSRFLRLAIALSPLFLGTYVAVSRWEDHWHHPTDSRFFLVPRHSCST